MRIGQETQTYILKYRLTSGRVRWATLGRVGDVTLTTARKRARRYVGVVADGGDPLRVKDGARDAPMFSAVAGRVLEEHVDARRKAATARLYRLAINGHLRPHLGALPIVDVSTTDIVRLQHRLRATPYLANRVIAVASKLNNRPYTVVGVAPAGFRFPAEDVQLWTPFPALVAGRPRASG